MSGMRLRCRNCRSWMIELSHRNGSPTLRGGIINLPNRRVAKLPLDCSWEDVNDAELAGFTEGFEPLDFWNPRIDSKILRDQLGDFVFQDCFRLRCRCGAVWDIETDDAIRTPAHIALAQWTVTRVD